MRLVRGLGRHVHRDRRAAHDHRALRRPPGVRADGRSAGGGPHAARGDRRRDGDGRGAGGRWRLGRPARDAREGSTNWSRHRPVIVSSGFRELIAPVLEREGVTLEVVANSLDARLDGWLPVWLDEAVCSVCGEPCKRGVLGGPPYVYAGDGYSDRCAALGAERVFARDGLARWLAARGAPYEPFEDLRERLGSRLTSPDSAGGRLRPGMRPGSGRNTGVAGLSSFTPGAADLETRAALLADRLSDGLKPLARVAYNYALELASRRRRRLSRHQPAPLGAVRARTRCRFLNDLWPATQERAERNPELLERIRTLAEALEADLGAARRVCGRDRRAGRVLLRRVRLPRLAADLLGRSRRARGRHPQGGERPGAADGRHRPALPPRLLPPAARPRGRQHEYWVAIDPKILPMARVTNDDGSPLRLRSRSPALPLAFQVWRVDVGRVPLLLLDTEIPVNDPVQRWTTAGCTRGTGRSGSRNTGCSGSAARASSRRSASSPPSSISTRAIRRSPPLELAAAQVAAGAPFEEALGRRARAGRLHDAHAGRRPGTRRTARDEFLHAFGDLPRRLGIDDEEFLCLCRVDPADADERPGMTPLALRVSGRRNGVSRLHGEVAREMWRPLFGSARPTRCRSGT